MPSTRRESPHAAPTASPVRCSCGAMVARLVPGGVEIKCRRCKRTQVVPLDEGPPGHG